MLSPVPGPRLASEKLCNKHVLNGCHAQLKWVWHSSDVKTDVAEAGAQICPSSSPVCQDAVRCYLKMVPALLELACSLITKVTAPASEPDALSRKFVTFKVP